METTTILLTVAIILLCALPIAVAVRNKSKKEKQFKEKISKIAGDGATLEKFDRWGNKAVAIDNLNHKLYFFSDGIDQEHKVIELSDIRQVSLIKTHHNGGSQGSGVIKQVDLYLLPKDKAKPNIELEFYNSERDSLTIRDELQLAEKWSAILETSISKSLQAK
jgi:hypothetical protein